MKDEPKIADAEPDLRTVVAGIEALVLEALADRAFEVMGGKFIPAEAARIAVMRVMKDPNLIAKTSSAAFRRDVAVRLRTSFLGGGEGAREAAEWM